MKYKVGDKVRIKDIDWYNKNKSKSHGTVACGGKYFDYDMKEWCGKTMTILEAYQTCYIMREDGAKDLWTDEMIEGLVEEEIKPKFKVGDKITNGKITFTILTLTPDRYVAEDNLGECGILYFNSQDGWKIVEEETKVGTALNPLESKSNANCLTRERVDEMSLDKAGQITDFEYEGLAYTLPDGYQFVDENGNVINATKIVLEKKKKEYPKTYEECRDYIESCHVEPFCADLVATGYKSKLIESFARLLVCRDAYWQIAGREMGLGKPWEPDWNTSEPKYVISCTSNGIEKQWETTYCKVLAFPTAEMRDAFYENFKELIEICKEFL